MSETGMESSSSVSMKRGISALLSLFATRLQSGDKNEETTAFVIRFEHQDISIPCVELRSEEERFLFNLLFLPFPRLVSV